MLSDLPRRARRHRGRQQQLFATAWRLTVCCCVSGGELPSAPLHTNASSGPFAAALVAAGLVHTSCARMRMRIYSRVITIRS
eukprot:SAG31_NODE_424_length_15826_cov_4.954664_10_plen_82_part_00